MCEYLVWIGQFDILFCLIFLLNFAKRFYGVAKNNLLKKFRLFFDTNQVSNTFIQYSVQFNIFELNF